ncbi:MAG: hypothetical protein ABW219_03540 [Ilumatobacteraceae bacterium]
MSGGSGRHGRGWWIAVLFMIGSSLFALGAVPWYAEAAGLRVTAVTFFVGSLFFTSAAFLQYRQAVDALAPGDRAARRVLVWAPHDIDWLACAVQLAGTLWFNWSTGNAVRQNLSAEVGDQRVWRPDALGSIAFLVASALACIAVHRAGSGLADRSTDWWIGVANMTGSVAFGVSAIASFIVPADGDPWDAELSNLGTFVGALCFLVGAALLLPAARRGPP